MSGLIAAKSNGFARAPTPGLVPLGFPKSAQPRSRRNHAGITETVAFVGLGHKFQIWEPGRFQNELAEATQKVRALKGELGSRSAARDAPGVRE